MNTDLRRLAERSLSDEFPVFLEHDDAQAIRALLDERDEDQETIHQHAHARLAAERRAAALEELLGQIVMEYPALDPKHPWAGFVDKARALLGRSEEATPAPGSMPWDDLSLPMHQAPAPRTAAVEKLRAYIYAIHVEGNIGGTAMQYIDTQLDAIEAEAAAPAGLDVERLAEAMHQMGFLYYATSGHVEPFTDCFDHDARVEDATDLSREYARLLRERETAEEPSA